jgi:hypothetical protein
MELLSRPSEHVQLIFSVIGIDSPFVKFPFPPVTLAEYTPVFKKNTLIFSGARCVAGEMMRARCGVLFRPRYKCHPRLNKGIN